MDTVLTFAICCLKTVIWRELVCHWLRWIYHFQPHQNHYHKSPRCNKPYVYVQFHLWPWKFETKWKNNLGSNPRLDWIVDSLTAACVTPGFNICVSDNRVSGCPIRYEYFSGDSLVEGASCGDRKLSLPFPQPCQIEQELGFYISPSLPNSSLELIVN